MVASPGPSHNVPVGQYVVFFRADDDAVAAAVLPTGPGRVFTTVSGADCDADDAMSVWENVAGGRTGRWRSAGDRPRMVAGGGNDGGAVFAMSDELSATLARAGPGRLRLIAEAWHADVASYDEGLDPDTAHAVVIGVAALVRDAVRTGERIYAWTSQYPAFRPE